ncbi:7592_t:CDS:2, partial [Diversispora eburnea]
MEILELSLFDLQGRAETIDDSEIDLEQKKFTQYINQFNEDMCNRNNISTIVQKSFCSWEIYPSYYEEHNIAQQILTH